MKAGIVYIVALLFLSSCVASDVANEDVWNEMHGYPIEINFVKSFGVNGCGGMSRPVGFAGDGEYFYISDPGNKRIIKTDKEGNCVRTTEEGELKSPGRLATCGNDIVVVDSFLLRIFKFNNNLENTGWVLDQEAVKQIDWYYSPRGIACDEEENLYVADEVKGQIVKFGKDGNFLSTIGQRGNDLQSSDLNYPVKLIFIKNDLFVFDLKLRAIKLFSKDGEFIKAVRIQAPEFLQDIEIIDEIFLGTGIESPDYFIFQFNAEGFLVDLESYPEKSSKFNGCSIFNNGNSNELFILDCSRDLILFFLYEGMPL